MIFLSIKDMVSEANRTVFVKVKLLGFLRKWGESTHTRMEIRTGSTVYDLLEMLTQRLGEEFRTALWDSSGQLHGGLELILNGQPIPPKDIKDTPILENSELALIPIIAGGKLSDFIIFH